MTADVLRSLLAGVNPSARALVLGLIGVFMANIAPASGQESKPVADQAEAAGGTVLNADFAKKLADPELDWPRPQGIKAAAGKDTEYARYDAARWQNIILSRPFAAASYGGRPVREEGRQFTAGVTADGYDAVFYHWETPRYRLQFCCTRQTISVMVEPKSSGPRPELTATEVQKRTEAMVAEVVRRGPQLLVNSSMKVEPTKYGYLVRFHQTDEEYEALRRDTTNRERGGEPGARFDTRDEWLTLHNIRTDGYSFVFNFPKIGVGPSIPSDEKAWFEERKPTTAPSR